jgi:cbb3-type cytochrome oxidase subunit 3
MNFDEFIEVWGLISLSLIFFFGTLGLLSNDPVNVGMGAIVILIGVILILFRAGTEHGVGK